MAPNLTADQRRTVIITAAVRIAEERGIWGVTHGTVQKRCTVPTSKSTVKLYFPTKDDLWRAVVQANPELRVKAEELGWNG